ncbi:MAG: ABC transporter ATP-binding protein [Eubacteriales bacterium]|jgi:ATP-binding cassette subfamily B protein
MKNIQLSVRNIVILFKILGKEQLFGLMLRTLSTVIKIVLPLLLIYFQKRLIQLIQIETTSEKILMFSVVSISCVLLAKKILEIIFGFINSVLNNKLSCKLEYTLHKKCVNAQLRAYDNHEIYDKMTIANRIGTSTITNYIFAFFDIAGEIMQFLSSAIILCTFSVWLLAAALIGAIPGIFVRIFGNKYEEFDKKRTSIVRRMNYFKNIAAKGEYTKETKLFGIIPFVCGEHKRYYDAWAKSELAYRDEDNRRRIIWQSATSLLIMVLPSLYLIWRASLNEIDVADFSYYLSLLTLCHGNLTAIINNLFDNELADSRIKDYFEFLNMPIDSRKGEDIPSEWLKEIPRIEFQNVSFRYSGSETNALDNVSFVIEAHEKVAIVGLNGAGKTTLIKLLCGLYEVSEGKILIGGRNIMEFSQVSVYRLFSVVFQDFLNYEMPFIESLSLGGEEKVTAEAVYEAFAHVDGRNIVEKRFLGDLNRSVGKIIDKDGVELSGGEHQKVALARSILQNRPMIILDEPTSNLDAYAETAILKNFLSHIYQKSVVIVSHRLSAVHFVDKIIVMENAHIIEQGTHSELMKRNGKYASMYELQANQYQ